MKFKYVIELEESNEFFKLLYNDLDCLFINRASINDNDPFYITTSKEDNAIIYNNPYCALYRRDIENIIDDFYNGNPKENGFKKLNIKHITEYQGNNSVLVSLNQNKGFWEYKE